MSNVRLTQVKKTFGALTVLHGIDIEIEPREFVVLVGPSGCGKSTLLRALAGLEEITSGMIEIGGKDVTGLEPADRGIAMVFQSYALYPHMTVGQNMSFGLKVAGVASAEIAARVKAAADSLQLTNYLDRKPSQLSGGQRQRVAIGRSIVRDPMVFLFDEPLSNLDAELRVHMRLELKRLHKRLGATMIYVTHDQVEAMTLADKIVVLQAGRVEQVGAPLTLFDDPANMFVAGFMGSPRMNFLPATLVEGQGFRLAVEGDAQMVVDLPHIQTRMAPGTEVVLGIRPQHLALSDDGPLRLVPDVIEQLGDVGYLYGQTPGNNPLVAQVADRDISTDQGEVRLTFRPQAALVFDKAGPRIR